MRLPHTLRELEKLLKSFLKHIPAVPVFTDDRLIERCYGLLQGKSKRKVAKERPEWFAQIHRGYNFPPPEGESLKMVENRTLPFLVQLQEWLRQNPGNVAISCHGNSLRPIRRVFEHLSLEQMLQLENPQDRAMAYALHVHSFDTKSTANSTTEADWRSILVPQQVKLATDQRNPLKIYY